MVFCIKGGLTVQVYQLVLPEQIRERALPGMHDDVGHLRGERVLHLAHARFYWPRMAK